LWRIKLLVPTDDVISETKLRRLIDPLISLGAAWRSLGERPVLLACLALAVVLVVLDRLEVQAVNKATAIIGDEVVPLVVLVREPVSWSRQLGEKAGELFAVYAENQRLKEENRRLLEWQAQAVKLGVENRSLRTILDLAEPASTPRHANARIVADSASPFIHTRLIDIGVSEGIAKGMAVLTPDGMVGRVIQVGDRSSRILLLTDLNSKVPVIIERSGDQALLVGDNSAQPRLDFLPMNPRFEVGDRIITSGRGGLLPPGLMVGEIARIDGSRVTVRPSVDWTSIDFVSVLRQDPLPPPESTETPSTSSETEGIERSSAGSSVFSTAASTAPNKVDVGGDLRSHSVNDG
jgi:rod shape-determining protein MreC